MDKENTISCRPEALAEGSRFFGGQAPLRMTEQNNCHCERSDATSYGMPRAHALAKTERGRSVFLCHPCVGGDLSGSLRNRFPVKRGMTGAISFCHSCQAQRERESMPRQARHDTFGQMGRSMVEMLGVLAIMGIVGMVGVKMYNMAMNKHHANTLIEQAQRRAVSAASQINLMGHAPSLADFSENTFGGGTFGGVTQEGLSKQFGIQVSGVSKPVCENILSSIGENTSLRRLSLTGTPTNALTTCADNNTFLMVYNDDLKGVGGDTEYCSADKTCTNACAECVNGLCVGECEVPKNSCDINDDCNQKNECMICDTDTHTCQDGCHRVQYLKKLAFVGSRISTGYIVDALPITFRAVVSGEYVDNPRFQGIVMVGSQYPIGFTSGYPKIASKYNDIVNNSGISITTDETYDITSTLSSTKNILTVEGNDYTKNYDYEADNGVVSLFPSYDTPSMKIYQFQMRKSGKLIFDFVPVLDPQGVPAMFDRVSSALFHNTGTGQFSYGE